MKPAYRYFPVNDSQKAWGLYATCAGRGLTRPGDEFPSSAHPDEYFFSWDKGRILQEWQLFLVESGRGTVEFRHRKFSIRKDSLIILPPGCWHRYRPIKNIGWSTLWIGFGGDLADRLVGGAGFNADGDVLHMPNMNRFRNLLSDTISDILESEHDNTYSTAAKIPVLIATFLEEQNRNILGASHTELIHRAQAHIAEHASEIVDFEQLASSFAIPYRTFRHIFAKETGTSPHQYQLEIRLARAKNLLRSTDMPISDIAATLGFNSTWYFAHFFQRRCRTSAAAYRKKHGKPAPN
jgi:AraC-like DNA-binding protein